MHEQILIVDFGSQVTQLIARRVREAGVYSEVVPFHLAAAAFERMKPRAVILSGGPASPAEAGSPRAPQEIFQSGVPVLGICYGQMLLAQQLGGKVESGHHREFGRAEVSVKAKSVLFDGIWDDGQSHTVWMSHGDRITALPPGFVVKGVSPNAPFAVIEDEARKYFGLMFHPEVVHTPDGAKLIENFLFKVAGCKGDWTMAAFRTEAVAKIRAQVGKGRVLCGLSGGVDSSVAAVLIHEAVGDQLTCVLVDHGLMRQNEAADVVAMFREHYNLPLVHVDASEEFISQLEGEVDPEKKRKTIGRLFIDVFEREAKKIGGADFLAQGTLYPDVIESVSFTGGPSVTIKSHHNVGGLPDRMNMILVGNRCANFSKMKCENLGAKSLDCLHILLGAIRFRPRLAIRLPGGVTREKLAILQKADAIYIDEIRKAVLYHNIWQAFCVAPRANCGRHGRWPHL